jgi:thiopeptide-type bacteriocin biosynthesis protein
MSGARKSAATVPPVTFADPAFAVMRRTSVPFRVVAQGVPAMPSFERAEPALAAMFRTAVQVASPSLATVAWRDGGGGTVQTARALERYLLRSSTRPTPFGLFAAYAVAVRGEATQLTISRCGDLRVLAAPAATAVDALQLTPLRWRVGDRLRYLAIATHGEAQGEAVADASTSLRELEWTPALDVVLDSVRQCVTAEAMIDALVALGMSAEQAQATLSQLLPSRLIATGLPRPLCVAPPAATDRGHRLADLDARQLPASGTVWARDERQPVLGPVLRSALCDAAATLQAIGQPYAIPSLAEWRHQLEARFERARVPLLRALDPLSGVPLGSLALEAMPMPERWLATIARIAARGQRVPDRIVRLEPGEIDRLRHGIAPRWPGAHLLATVRAASAEAIDASDFMVHARGVAGPTGLRLCGRFADGDATLAGRMRAHVEQLGEIDGDGVLFAEVTHGLRTHEDANGRRVSPYRVVIDCGVRATMPDVATVGVDDLSIFSDGARLHLWSERHACRVVPRITSAQLPSARNFLDAYRLLDALQYGEGPVAYQWAWTGVPHLPFTPGVFAGQVQLCAAAWHLRADDPDVAAVTSRPEPGWRQHIAELPRQVMLCDGEDRWPLDLDDPGSLPQLATRWQRDETVVLEASPVVSAQLPARDDDGDRYVSEFVVPLAVRGAREVRDPVAIPQPFAVGTHTVPHGDGWLYARLLAPYDAHAKLLAMLRDRLPADLRRNAFLVRYGEPTAQLRLRVKLPSAVSARAGWRDAVEQLCAHLLRCGLASAVTYETYVREVDRYGGLAAMDEAERSFIRQTRLLWTCLDAAGGLEARDGLSLALGFAGGLRRAWCGRGARAVTARLLSRWDAHPSASAMRARTRDLRAGARTAAARAGAAWVIGARLGTALRRLGVHDGDDEQRSLLLESHVHMFCNRVFEHDWQAREYAVWCLVRAQDQRDGTPQHRLDTLVHAEAGA